MLPPLPPPLLPYRHKAGELNCELPIIISNHPDLAHIAATFGIEFRHIPMATRNAAGKAAQEAEIDAVLQELGIDLIVMARYMQVKREKEGALRSRCL